MRVRRFTWAPLLAAAALAAALLAAGFDFAIDRHHVVRRGDYSTGSIALTFDDGPDPRYTPQVLDILAQHGARATFFVIGEHAQAHPELIERMVAEGHEVAHHTHTHPQMRSTGREDIEVEFEQALETLAALGIEPAWYRPPRKDLCLTQRWLSRRHGMRVALWTRCVERSRFESADQMATTLIAETQPGDILLAHDGRLCRSMTVDALPAILDGLAEKNLRAVTLSDLQ